MTVGTLREFPFRSLVAQVARILPAEAEALWQTGSTPVADLGIDGRRLVPIDEMRRVVAEADLTLAHLQRAGDQRPMKPKAPRDRIRSMNEGS